MAEMRRLEKAFVNSRFVGWYHGRLGLGGAIRLAKAPLGSPLLEIGCGNGQTTEAILRQFPEIQVTAIDYDESYQFEIKFRRLPL